MVSPPPWAVPEPFFQWMVLAFPLVLMMFLVLCVVLGRLNKPEVKHVEGVEDHIAKNARSWEGWAPAAATR